MINEETFVRQIVKVKPHQHLEESLSPTTIDEEACNKELQNRRQSLSIDAGCQSYDILMKVIPAKLVWLTTQ